MAIEPFLSRNTDLGDQLDRLALADPVSAMKIAWDRLQFLDRCQKLALHQAHQSFEWMIRACIFGLILFAAAVTLPSVYSSALPRLSLVSGGTSELISATFAMSWLKASSHLTDLTVASKKLSDFLIKMQAAGALTPKTRDRVLMEIILKYN